MTLQLPKDERFSLTDQIRRSSGSVGGQIAEAWAKRRYPKHFVSKLTDADGEQLETIHWLNIITDRRYIPSDQLEKAHDFCAQIGKMLGSMVRKPEAFAPPSR